MQLEKAKIETWAKHPSYNEIEEQIKYYIKLSFEIPGGIAIYDIPTCKEVNESLEAANSLKITQGKKK